MHLIREPLPMLYNDGAVILGLVYGFLPFAVLPLYATLERLDRSLLEAAADLGAKPLRYAVARHDSAVRAGNSRRRDSGVRAVPGHLSDFRSAGRQQDHPDRQSGAEPVHGVARLAVRRGGVDCVDGRSRWRCCSRRGGVARSCCEDGAGRVGVDPALYALRSMRFLHVPLLILAVFSFNASKFTVWEGFSLHWYSAAFADRDLIESAANSLIIAIFATAARDHHRDAGGLRVVEAIIDVDRGLDVSFAGDAGNRDRRFAAGVLSVELSISASCGWACTR